MFWGPFAKLRKATISFVMSLCPRVRKQHFGSDWADFHEIRYLSIFRKSVEKMRVLGPFAKLRKATISFVMSLCPRVRKEHFGSD